MYVYFKTIEWKALKEIQVISTSVLIFAGVFLIFTYLVCFFPDSVCSFVTCCILFASQRPSLDLYCFSYSFHKQVMFIKVRTGMKDCEVAPLQLLEVHISKKLYKRFLWFALTWKFILLNFVQLSGLPIHLGALEIPLTSGLPTAFFLQRVYNY